MRRILNSVIVFSAVFPSIAISQPLANSPNQSYPPSAINRPYWADKPMIEIIGRAIAEFDANRVTLNFSIKELNSDSQKALVKLNTKARPTIEALRKIIGKNGDFEVTYQLVPIYQQYKNSDGVKVSNQRDDKIENYSARYNFRVELNDISLAPKVKAEILAIEGAETMGSPIYSFEPTAKQTREVFALALEDAKIRAKMVGDLYNSKLKLLTFGEGQDDCKSMASTEPLVERKTIADVEIDVPDPVQRLVVDSSENSYEYQSNSKPSILASDLILPIAPEKNKLDASVCMVFAIE